MSPLGLLVHYVLQTIGTDTHAILFAQVDVQ